MARDFNPAGQDRLWAADITQFRTEEGWLHFAGVIDLYSRRVVGWAMGTSPTSDLVIDALVMAFERRRPDQRVIHHADRGAAYTSLAFGQQLAWIHGRQTWPTRDLLRSAIFDYVEGFYNPSRIQKRLGYRSPAEFETTTVA